MFFSSHQNTITPLCHLERREESLSNAVTIAAVNVIFFLKQKGDEEGKKGNASMRRRKIIYKGIMFVRNNNYPSKTGMIRHVVPVFLSTSCTRLSHFG